MNTYCTKCGIEADPGDVFCGHCGHKLTTPAGLAVPTIACPACGCANLLRAMFCDECGAVIPADVERGGRKPLVVGAALAGSAGVAALTDSAGGSDAVPLAGAGGRMAAGAVAGVGSAAPGATVAGMGAATNATALFGAGALKVLLVAGGIAATVAVAGAVTTGVILNGGGDDDSAANGQGATATPLVSPTNLADGTSTPSPSPSATPSVKATPSATLTPTEASPTATETPAPPTPTTEATATQAPTSQPTATTTATATSTATSTATRTPTPESVSTVRGVIWAQVSPDAYQACPNCVIRLSGPNGEFTASAGAGGAFSVSNVPAGTYRLYRVCGSATIPAQHPWNAMLGYAALTAPAGSINIDVPACP